MARVHRGTGQPWHWSIAEQVRRDLARNLRVTSGNLDTQPLFSESSVAVWTLSILIANAARYLG